MSLQLNGDTGVTFNDASLQGAAASPFGLKNRLINGDFRIDQRNAGASATPTADAASYLDRWRVRNSQSSKFTVQQNAGSVTPPSGFSNYFGVTSLSAYSVISTDYFGIEQVIEGFNIADLEWGTAAAKTVTLSFWVRSSLTGTFSVNLNNNGGRGYPASYTISSANTWEQKTITIAGDTSGTWGSGNGYGIGVSFGLGYGSTYQGTVNTWGGGTALSFSGATSVVGTNGATLYITGVQLEQNTSATPFERRLYNQELANCQRYYQRLGSAVGMAATSTVFTGSMQFFVPMRTSPTLSVSAAMSVTDTNTADYTQSSASVNIVSGNRVNNLGVNFNLPNFSGMILDKLHITIPTAYSNGILLASAEF
jgi:hypothetical protein